MDSTYKFSLDGEEYEIALDNVMKVENAVITLERIVNSNFLHNQKAYLKLHYPKVYEALKYD